jgi:hypothetical protein
MYNGYEKLAEGNVDYFDRGVYQLSTLAFIAEVVHRRYEGHIWHQAIRFINKNSNKMHSNYEICLSFYYTITDLFGR